MEIHTLIRYYIIWSNEEIFLTSLKCQFCFWFSLMITGKKQCWALHHFSLPPLQDLSRRLTLFVSVCLLSSSIWVCLHSCTSFLVCLIFCNWFFAFLSVCSPWQGLRNLSALLIWLLSWRETLDLLVDFLRMSRGCFIFRKSFVVVAIPLSDTAICILFMHSLLRL